MKNRGPLYVMICYILWGLLPAFWKLLREVDSLYVLCARIVWSLVLMMAILTVRRGFGTVRAVLRNRREWLRLTLGGCCICVNWGVFIWAVNNGHMLNAAVDGLNPGGRLAVITFHSLEDRIVKRTMQGLAKGCTCPPEFPVCVCGNKPKIKLITRKPIVSGEAELEENPRARSAKLRVAEKCGFDLP